MPSTPTIQLMPKLGIQLWWSTSWKPGRPFANCASTAMLSAPAPTEKSSATSRMISGRRRGSSATTAAPTNGITMQCREQRGVRTRLDHPTARVRNRPIRMNAPTAMPSA